MKKRARKPAPRQNYQALWKYTEQRRLELEQKMVATRDELENSKALYEKAFPETVRLYQELRKAREEMKAYKERLANMLDDDQRQAALAAWCPEDEYAIQLIRLCKRKIEELSSLKGRYS